MLGRQNVSRGRAAADDGWARTKTAFRDIPPGIEVDVWAG